MKKIFFLLFFVIFTKQNSVAQYIAVNDTYTAQQLVENVFASSGCAQVSNIQVNGENIGGNLSYGYFERGTSTFPFANGILLSTGKAVSAVGPNIDAVLSEGSTAWTGDSDLEQALGVSNTINATTLEFDFIPLTNKISFDYIFASEQYLRNPSASQCGYTDGFAFLLKETGASNYQNIALVPGTTTPVSVNTIRGGGTICPAVNAQYFDAFNPVEYPTRFNGQTKILKAQADVIIGQSYHIKLVIADQGNNLYDSGIFLGGGTFQSETYLGEDRTQSKNNPYCAGENVVLNAVQTGATSYQWFKDGVFTGITTPTYTISDNTNTNEVTYSVLVNLNGTCTSKGKIIIQFAAMPIVTNSSLSQCDTDNNNQSIFNLEEIVTQIKDADYNITEVNFYETSGGSAISNISTYTSGPRTLIVEVKNRFGCTSTATLNLNISSTTIPNVPFQKCDEDGTLDGKTTVNLPTEISPSIQSLYPGTTSVTYYETAENAIIKRNPVANIFNNTNTISTLYARLANGLNCNGIVAVVIKINYLDPETIKEQKRTICPNETITLQANPNYSSYVWSTGATTSQINVNQAGNYSVTITDSNNCKGIQNFQVTPSAPASNIDAIIEEFSDNNTVLVTYQDNGGDYEFSIDNSTFQDSPQFNFVAPGEYTITIRDKNGCMPNATKNIFVLDYPKFFTPNNDGINDFWTIKNMDKRAIASIAIFNRFGKLITILNKNNPFWDGKYRNELLPSDDFWFILTFFNGKTLKTHFSLKR